MGVGTNTLVSMISEMRTRSNSTRMLNLMFIEFSRASYCPTNAVGDRLGGLIHGYEARGASHVQMRIRPFT